KLRTQHRFSISPEIELGFYNYKLGTESYNEKLFRNKFYWNAGVEFSTIIDNWRFSLSPTFDMVRTDFRFDSQRTNFLEVRVPSINLNLGVGYIIDLGSK